MLNSSVISILRLLDAHRDKWITGRFIMKALNIAERDFGTAVAIFKTRGFVKVYEGTGSRESYMIKEAGICFLKESDFLGDAVLTDTGSISNKSSMGETEVNSKPTISAYALMHVYLAMFGGQAVTQQNKNEIVKGYGYSSGEQLRNDFTAFQNVDKRLELNTSNKRSALTHLERYKLIFPLLEKQNKEAFEAAKKDFDLLQKEYNKYY